MKIAVTSEHVLFRTPDGTYWAKGAPLAFWRRYLDVFDELYIVARVMLVEVRPCGSELLADSRVHVAEVPFYRGPVQFLRCVKEIKKSLKSAIGQTDAVLMRVPSVLATLMAAMLRSHSRPYGLEVVGDPADVFAAGGVSHFLRPFFRYWFTRNQKIQCQEACAVSYVTESHLQSRYRAGEFAFQTHYSSLDLPEEAYVAQARQSLELKGRPFVIISVASLEQLYKGPDILIQAVAKCIRAGAKFRLEFVGDGYYRKQLMQQAAELGIGAQVHFRGQIPSGPSVWQCLDDADLFVLPSITEGLPRAMIEAMARALPCIGTAVGGIPELLGEDYLVPPGCPISLAKQINQVASDPGRLSEMSAENLQRAKAYQSNELRSRRMKLYCSLGKQTGNWLKGAAA
jgi:glycosyltransferase involved in cell wall biosynthesis